MRSRHSITEHGWSMHCTPSTLYGNCPTPVYYVYGITGYLEEDVRFELTVPFETSVFKTDAIGHSANLPLSACSCVFSNSF